jgi:hypothetical protein
MSQADRLRQSFAAVQVNESFTDAVLAMRDGSQLLFCHRTDERFVRVASADERPGETGQAGQIVVAISRFRLNRKHLDILFQDGSRWEALFSA